MESDDQERITYKDVNLLNLDNYGSIIQTVIINGKEMNIKDFKKSKGIQLGFINIPRRRYIDSIDTATIIDNEL